MTTARDNRRAVQRTLVAKRANLALTVAWALAIPAGLAFGWLELVVFVSVASIYANAVSHLAAWRADDPDPEILHELRTIRTLLEKNPA